MLERNWIVFTLKLSRFIISDFVSPIIVIALLTSAYINTSEHKGDWKI